MFDNRNQEIQMLIRFFNMQCGCSFKVTNSNNMQAVSKCLDVANAAEVQAFIRQYSADNPDSKSLIDCCNQFVEKKSAEKPADSGMAVKSSDPTAENVQHSLGILEQAVVKMISDMKSEEIKKSIMDNVQNTVRDFIASEYGHIERKIEVRLGDKKVEMDGILHEKFDTVLKFVMADEPVFLTGPAGSGKNVLCKQVAKALGLDFYFSNAVTQEYKITGFTDANGVFHESQFYKAFKNGGLFMLDEMDASIPEVLVILNAAIANRYFDFPAPIGYVEAHPNFRVIAAGNTFGHGADYEYVGRNQLDMASLDRFAMVRIGYSKQIEMGVANQDAHLVDFAEAFRKSAEKAGIKTLVSYRSIGRIAKLKNDLGLEETLRTCLVKSMEKDDANIILKDMSVRNEYTEALRNIVNAM